MSIPDAILDLVVAALPDAYLWEGASTDEIPTDDLVVFDSSVPPTPPLRYVVFYPDIGTLNALAVCKRSDTATFRWQVTSVAPDGLRARWLAGTVRDAIVDQRPTADGWAPGLIEHTFSPVQARNEQVRERRVVYGADQYQLLAARS